MSRSCYKSVGNPVEIEQKEWNSRLEELAMINQCIQGLKQTQTEMRCRLTSDIAESSESVIADVGKLSDHVYRLEVQLSKHYSKLKEVTKLVLILLDKITIISSAVENISCVSDKANNDEYEEISVKNKNETVSNTVPSQNKRYGLGATDDNTQSYGANGSNDASVLENKGGMNKSEYKKEISATVSERNIKDVEVNDKNRSDKEVKEESISTKTRHNLQNDNENNSSCSNNRTINISTKMNKSRQNVQNQTVRTETIRKNEFGYKQKRSDIKSDNRVDFHSNRTPYPRQTVETATDQNIKSEKTQSQSASSASFGDTGDNHYVESSDDFVPPKDINGWLKYAHQITRHGLRLQSGKVKRGWHGHDVILVLDTSERMKGSFEELKQAALEYVNGKQQVSESRHLTDNIGLAVFGRETRLLHEATSDYELIKIFINQLRPEGESPLLSGLIMGLAGVQGGTTTRIMEIEIQGHMIVFTDGTSEHVTLPIERGRNVNPLYLTGDFRHVETNSVIQLIASHSIKIFYVPIGQNQHNAIMEAAVQQTNGKVIKPSELHRLIKMTQVMSIAARVASEIRHSPELHNRETIGGIIESIGNSSDRTEDCIDMVEEFVNPVNTIELRRGMFVELKCQTLQLGDRIRRGPYWIHDNQDSNMAGTVIGQGNEGYIWVEWDSGNVNVYLYNEMMEAFSIVKVNEPRILYDEMIAVGCRVVRAHDWTYGNEDGGPGCCGTVLNVKQDGNVVVRWDNKLTKSYKVGCNGLIEVKVCDTDNPIQWIDEGNRQQQPEIIIDDSINTKKEKVSFSQNSKINNYVLPAKSVTATWEYQENEFDWKGYPSELNARIEKAFERKPNGQTIIQMDQSTYRVNFKTMKQENPQDKTTVYVRRKDVLPK